MAPAISLLSVGPSSAAPEGLTPRAPIYIDGNDDFTPANGVTSGSGTVGASSNGSGENWVVVSYSPQIKNYAVAVVGAGENIYIANSSTGGANYFTCYNTIADEWSSLSNPPQWFKNGTCLAWDNGNYIYALLGGSYSDTDAKARHYFFRYSIPDNSWQQLENTPDSGGQGAGDAITWVPGSALVTPTDWIYAIVGAKWESNQTTFRRYDINDNSWETLTYNPSWSGEGSDDGSSLVWAGGDYLYALQGEWDETNEDVDRAFARFDLSDNTWDDLPDIPEEGGIADGGSLVWVGGSYSDNIYALGGGYVGPGETPGDNFYRYGISENGWTQLDSLPYGITDQNGPRLGYASENIYCWRGYYNAGAGDPDVLWAYAVPETKVGVSVSISPDYLSGLPGETLDYTVTVRNIGENVDTYDLTISDNENWGPTLSENLLENIGPGENGTITLTVKIPENAPLGAEDEITVTAQSLANPSASDNASCIVRVVSWTGTGTFGLENLYAVGLDADLWLGEGSKLVVRFYTYADTYQDENIVWTCTTPDNVSFSKTVPHPQGEPVEKARLDLTTANTENVIATISSFTVTRDDLFGRIMEIKGLWPIASPDERNALFSEIMDIKGQWPYAPS